MSSIAVVGAGAWGTALALHAARAGNRVTLIARDSSAVRRIREERIHLRLHRTDDRLRNVGTDALGR